MSVLKQIFPFIILFVLSLPGLCQDMETVVVREVSGEFQTIEHLAYTTCYSRETLQPRYVSWTLTPEHLAVDEVTRDGYDFEPDPATKGVCATTDSYKGTGYDRGHMCPAADCKWSERAMYESFFLTNICLQDRVLNAESWCNLEKQCRFWCRYFYKTTLYVVSGPLFVGNPKYVGKDKMPVPDAFWKVVCRKDTRSGKWEAVGFLFPNEPCTQPIKDFICSVDEIEAVTGLDFFSNLPDSVEDVMEADGTGINWKF